MATPTKATKKREILAASTAKLALVSSYVRVKPMEVGGEIVDRTGGTAAGMTGLHGNDMVWF